MSARQLAFIILGAVLVALVTVIVLRLLGITEGAGVIGGGAAGGVAGALGAYQVSKKPARERSPPP